MKAVRKFLAENPEIQIVYNEMRDSEKLMYKKFEPLDNYANSDIMTLMLNNQQNFERGVYSLIENLVYLEFIDLASFDNDKQDTRSLVNGFVNELKVLLESNYEEK